MPPGHTKQIIIIRNLASGCDIPYSTHGCALYSHLSQGIIHLLMHAALLQQGIPSGRYYVYNNHKKIDLIVPLCLKLDLLLLPSFPL